MLNLNVVLFPALYFVLKPNTSLEFTLLSYPDENNSSGNTDAKASRQLGPENPGFLIFFQREHQVALETDGTSSNPGSAPPKR